MPEIDFIYDVFLSHSSKDKMVVRELAERLRMDGLQVWFDEWHIQPGDNIPSQIEHGLEHSRVLILCMSANAFDAAWPHLESQAFRFRDPLNKERRFIPIRLDETPIKGSLGQFLYISWLPEDRISGYLKLLESLKAISKSAIFQVSHSPSTRQPRTSIDTKSTSHLDSVVSISRALRYLAKDRFDTNDFGHSLGGWALSYARFVPFAFPNRKPGVLSLDHSITVTHWVIRGLVCLRWLEKQTRCLSTEDSRLLADLLRDAAAYLSNHYRDGKAGLFKTLSQQELKLVPDVRHSSTMAKGLMALSNGHDHRVKPLLRFVMDCALSSDGYDHRVSTHAEILAAIELLRQNCQMHDRSITEGDISTARRLHEDGLLAFYKTHDLIADVGEIVPGLFFDSYAGAHMAPYYTWWALDCYGQQMLASTSDSTRLVYESVIAGLLRLEETSGGESGFPLTLEGEPDAGATAQVADILARLDWNRHCALVKRALRFVTISLSEPSEARLAYPFTIWALFSLLKTCHEHGVSELPS